MKNKTLSVLLPALMLMALAGCALPVESSSVSPSESSETPNSTSEEPSTSSSSESHVQTSAISSIRSVQDGTLVTIEGIVVTHNYTGQITPYITGFWIADQTGSIYVYGEVAAKSVQVGNRLTLSGTIGHYIPTNDQSGADAVNYKGMLQIASPTIISNDGQITNEIPQGAITETTIEDIEKTPLSTDITGNIYKVKGRYHVYDNGEFTNYNLDDLNRVDSILAYTQSNGKDYAWTNDLNGKTLEMLIVVSIGKPSAAAWRMCPVKSLGEVSVTAQEEANYGARRALNAISDSYNTDTTVKVLIADPLLEGLTVSYTSTSDKITISQVELENNIIISTSETKEVQITAIANYSGASASLSKTISLTGKPTFNSITIAEARAKNDGESVTLEAVVARVTYAGSMTKQGLFLVDSTGSMFAYNSTATNANLTNVQNGNKVVVTGKLAHYIKDATNAASEGYSGDFQITEVTVDDLDTNIYQIPAGGVISTSTIEEIATTSPHTNITGLVYSISAKVSKSAGAYGSYTLYGLTDSTKGVPLYSQNNAADYDWLSEYIGKNVVIILGIQNLNLKASGSWYRGCPISIVSVIE